MKNGKIPVVILVRVSTVRQETARQISELQQHAAAKGYHVVEVQAAHKMTIGTACGVLKNWRSVERSRKC